MNVVSFPSTNTPALPLYIAVNSDKQQITYNAQKADALHTQRLSGCACIANSPAASLSPTQNFWEFWIQKFRKEYVVKSIQILKK